MLRADDEASITSLLTVHDRRHNAEHGNGPQLKNIYGPKFHRRFFFFSLLSNGLADELVSTRLK